MEYPIYTKTEEKRKRKEEEAAALKKQKEKQAAIDIADNPVDGGQMAAQLDLDITNEDKENTKNHLKDDEKMADIAAKRQAKIELSVSEKFAEALALMSPSALAFSMGGLEGSKRYDKMAKNKADILIKQATIQNSGGSITPYQQASLGLRREEIDLHKGKETRLGKHFGWKKGETIKIRREKFAKNFNTDPVVKNLRQSVIAGQSALELIQTGTPLGDKSVRVAVARLVGDVGRLSDFDIKQYTGNMSAARRASRMLREMWDGNLPKQDREEFAQFISKVLMTKKNQLNTESQVWARRAQITSGGEITEKEAAQILQPTSMVNPKERTKDTPIRHQKNPRTGLWRLTYANGQTIEVTKEVAQELTGR